MGFLDFLSPKRETALKYIKEGDEFYRKNRLEEAIAAYRKALNIDPDNKEVKNKLKEIYREKDTLKAVFSFTDTESYTDAGGESFSMPQEEGERRRYVRAGDERPVQYRLIQKKEEEEEIIWKGNNKNISEGGILLITDNLVPVGVFLELRFDFPPPDAATIWVIGKIVRAQEIVEEGVLKYGLGIKFTNISPKDQQRISNYVAGWQKQKRGNN